VESSYILKIGFIGMVDIIVNHASLKKGRRGNKMEIKTTNEIAGNIFGEVYFKCPFCNSNKVQDKQEEGRWYCHICKKYFFEPITIMAEGIPLDKNWVSVDSIIKELNALEPFVGSDVDFPHIYELICKLKNYKFKKRQNKI
jgi:transcription elongation factor Elf1